jgi:pilus assembly protein CpaB
MNSKRIVFLLLAVIVAGTTAFLARAWLQAERAAIAAQIAGPKPVAAPSVQVLVARNALRTGQLIKPEDLRWQAWPQGALPQTYIIEGKRPLSDFVGAVARVSFRVGQPLVEADIVMPGSRGFLAAVLRPGLRAVSVPATATTVVSGFIYAGDRVDVLLTHTLKAEGSSVEHHATETILRNARVIAMDQKLDFAPGDKPDVAKTATLELTAKQTEIVTLAVKMGDLSLVLRSLQDEDERDSEGNSDDATAELGQSYTHDTQVSRLIKEPGPPKPPQAAKPAIFVLRGPGRTKLELDGTTSPDGLPPGESEKPSTPNAPAAPKGPTFTRTNPSVLQ